MDCSDNGSKLMEFLVMFLDRNICFFEIFKILSLGWIIFLGSFTGILLGFRGNNFIYVCLMIYLGIVFFIRSFRGYVVLVLGGGFISCFINFRRFVGRNYFDFFFFDFVVISVMRVVYINFFLYYLLFFYFFDRV